MMKQPTTMGAFSVSLAVNNLAASREFYEKLGFELVFGEAAQNWLILRNGTATIGLFQGMFQRNILTFNPGWDEQARPVDAFTDVREHQRRLKAQGLELATEVDENGSGPGSLMLIDPDGNPVLIDQHVAATS
jgi:lactoylglutathione lyase